MKKLEDKIELIKKIIEVFGYFILPVSFVLSVVFIVPHRYLCVVIFVLMVIVSLIVVLTCYCINNHNNKQLKTLKEIDEAVKENRIKGIAVYTKHIEVVYKHRNDVIEVKSFTKYKRRLKDGIESLEIGVDSDGLVLYKPYTEERV